MIREAFIAVFDVITDPSKVDPAEYVGFIVLYSSSSMETFLFAKNCLPQSGDEFLLFVEMDNTEKKSN
jgi:SHS2 domain-containing protein